MNFTLARRQSDKTWKLIWDLKIDGTKKLWKPFYSRYRVFLGLLEHLKILVPLGLIHGGNLFIGGFIMKDDVLLCEGKFSILSFPPLMGVAVSNA